MNQGPRLVFIGTTLGSLLIGGCAFLLSPLISSAAGSLERFSGTQPETALADSGQADNFPSASAGSVCALDPEFPNRIRKWCEVIEPAARQNHLPAELLAAVIWQESGGNPKARSASGAIGLMQVMPRDGLAANFQCQNGPCFSKRPAQADLIDPEYNVRYGARLLAGLVHKYGSLREGLRAYGPMNMGYSYADRVLGIYRQFRNP